MSNITKIFTSLTRGSVACKKICTFNAACNFNKDLIKSVTPITSTTDQDMLLNDLKNTMNSEAILNLVGTNHKIMNSKQLMQALRSLFNLQKSGNSNISTKQIIVNPNFEKLCHRLKLQAGLLDLRETLEALKVVSFIGVSSKAIIVQVLLQLLRHDVNNLSISNIMFLDFMLRQLKMSPLVEGLLIALPIVFETNLPIKIDKGNMTQLAECLHYASKRNISVNCVHLIINSLMKLIDLQGSLDAKTANGILWSLCDMEPDETFVPLFKKAMNGLLVEGFEKLDYKDIATTLSKISYKTFSNFMFYYDDVFYDTCANYIIEKDLGLEEAIFTLQKFDRINHTNENLLNYVSEKYATNPEIFKNATPLHLYIIATVTALSEYKPTHWQVIEDGIKSTKCFENYNKFDIVWLKLAASLCSLDIYNFNVFKNALSESYLKHILKHGYPNDYHNYVLILQAIYTFQPEYKFLLPENSVTQSLVAKVKLVEEYPLQGVLHKIFGGEQYVNTSLKTRQHHHIDHVLTMQSDGTLIPFAKKHSYLEDIKISEESSLILILALNQLHYTTNTKMLKATSLLMIKTLEAKGCIVVPICMEVWEGLQDYEKSPFIKQAIKLKVETEVGILNAVG